MTRKKAPDLWIFLALLWGQFFFALSPNWLGDSYYDYGWLVGPLVIYLAYARWRDQEKLIIRRAIRPIVWLSLVLLTALVVPLRILQEIDYSWRLPLWIHGLLVFTLTHLAIGSRCGWRLSRSLLPATLLLFLLIPLPTRLEQPFVRSLTDLVLQFTAWLLPFSGYPVNQVGSAFIVGGDLIDVAEGCSGIRSFQSCLAAALVLGELQRLDLLKRFFLVVASLVIAILANSFRVFLLARLAHHQGKEAMDAAHDTIGMWATILTFSLVGALSWFLGSQLFTPRKSRQRSTNQPSRE